MPATVSAAELDMLASTVSALHAHAPEVHRLVVERVDALFAVAGEKDRSTETAREFVERVHAHVNPIPPEACGFDDGNSYYNHVGAAYGRLVYSGTYPVWAEDGESFRTAFAEIAVPTWVVTEPDGSDRYRAETAEMVAALDVRVQTEKAELEAMMERILAEHRNQA